MSTKNLVIGIVAVLLIVLIALVVLLVVSVAEEPAKPQGTTTFSVLTTGTAADYAYTTFSYRGDGNITAISYDSQPTRQITIINDSQAIQADRLQELVDQVDKLEAYGYSVTVSNEPKINAGINIVPTGAIPSYALFNLQQNYSNGTILYIGDKNLLISSGIKELSWYSGLTDDQKKRIVVYNGTLDDFLDGNISIDHDILYQSWMAKNITSMAVSGSGVKTSVVGLGQSGFIRMIYDFSDLNGVYDSSYLQTAHQYLTPDPQTIYPWEKSNLEFQLNRTTGTAFMSIIKDGNMVDHEQLLSVTDQNVFIKRLQFSDPGEYIITVNDNSGTIATGLLHITEINISLQSHQGVTYVFSVLEDGNPMNNAEAMVWLGNSSSQRKFYITGGTVTVPAQLNKGANVFNFDIAGSTIPVTVVNQEDPILLFYFNYGVPGVALVVVVYFGARMTRRPTYRLRFGDSANYVRQEMTLPVDRAVESFKRIQEDMKLGNAPITPQEFSISMKRYLTNGADVTEGNVEEILKKLVKLGHLESYHDYYQLKGDGDVKRNALTRMIKEKLIESGTMFTESGGKFETKNFEIGFFGENFTRKGLIVVENKDEITKIMAQMSEAERAKLRIMQSNDIVSFVTIDNLSGVL